METYKLCWDDGDVVLVVSRFEKRWRSSYDPASCVGVRDSYMWALKSEITLRGRNASEWIRKQLSEGKTYITGRIMNTKRPEYEKDYISLSNTLYPFCNGYKWINFSSNIIWYKRQAIPLKRNGVAWIDFPYYIPGVSECIKCGAVSS